MKTIWLAAVLSPNGPDLATWAAPTEADLIADLRDIYDADGDIGDADILDTLSAAGYEITIAPYAAEWMTT